jgi:hypothetical protein
MNNQFILNRLHETLSEDVSVNRNKLIQIINEREKFEKLWNDRKSKMFIINKNYCDSYGRYIGELITPIEDVKKMFDKSEERITEAFSEEKRKFDYDVKEYKRKLNCQRKFSEEIRNLSFFQRLFGWKTIKSISDSDIEICIR